MMNDITPVRTQDFQLAKNHLLGLLKRFKQYTDGHLHLLDRRVFGPVTPRLIDIKVCDKLRRVYGNIPPDGRTEIPDLLDDESQWRAVILRDYVIPGTHLPFIVKVNRWNNSDSTAENLQQMLALLLDYGVEEECRITMGKHPFTLSCFKARDKKACQLRDAFVVWPTRSTRDMVIEATVDFGKMVRTLEPVRRMRVRNYLVSFHHMPVDIAHLLVP